VAILPLIMLPDPLLRAKAKKIRQIDSSVVILADDMVATMRFHNGVGLAANQVGILKRVVVLEVPDDSLRVLINPEIIKKQGEREVEEGCLSVPGYRGLVTRSIWVKARSLSIDGTEIRLKAEGLLAQALEHEIDHLNGIVYVDHLKRHEDLWKIEQEQLLEADEPESASIS
jgi:peptide deformylase